MSGDTPRFSTDHFLGSFRQKPPTLGSLSLPESLAEATVKDLEGRGHKVTLRKGAFAAPCLLIWGDADAIGPPAVGRELCESLPDARLHIVRGGDHNLAQTHADQIAPLITEHLQ